MAKLRRNLGKKGMMTDFIADIFAFFLYVLSLMVFMMMFAISFGGCNNLTPSNSVILTQANERLGENMLFLNYLRTDVIITGGTVTYAELISQSCRNNDFDELKELTQKFIEEELNKNLIENPNSGLYKRPLVELYIECNPPKKGNQIYKLNKLPGCPMQIQCDSYTGVSITGPSKGYVGVTPDSGQINVINLPLPFKEGDAKGNHARLVINDCAYIPPSSSNPLSPQTIQAMRDKCV
jgi:hypothetical protein